MEEASSEAGEVRLGIDFAEHQKSSSLYYTPEAATDLYFSTQYSQSTWEQFKSCLWKQWWTYWRSPDYNLVRFCFIFIAALNHGKGKLNYLSMIIGAIYVSVLFVGINNCSTV
ncbi:hypothetical protein QYF36_000245 [Acer negundo]|nr:hypothetical protein QYF36_000245 [Acer negundo]